jgi:hypothetical protein
MADSKTIDVFQRVEDKYRISRREAREILNEMKGYIKKDQYFQYTVHNIYYDSPDSQMIISSLNSDRFKEKLRLRCYEQPSDDTLCFLETKKKFGDIVYKKRIALNHKEAMAYLNEGIMHHVDNNTADEIDYLINYYSCVPKTLILYDRTCFSAVNEADVRVTFDANIRYRNDDINLTERGDEKLLAGNDVIMEIKAMNRYPMWLVRILSERKLYKHSFSKYGMIYRQNYQDMTVTGTPVMDRYMNEKENRVCSVQY